MKIRIRPYGTCASSFDIEEAYIQVREDWEVIVSSIELLNRILLGVADGEIPYGITEISIYDRNGFKHMSKVTKNGEIANKEIMTIHPLNSLDTVKDELYKASLRADSPKEVCGNCEYMVNAICTGDKSDRFRTYVDGTEEKCEVFKENVVIIEPFDNNLSEMSTRNYESEQ